MDQAEKLKILDYLNQSSEVFNGMVKEVTQRVLSSQLPTELDPFNQSAKALETIHPAVKLNIKKFLQHQFDLLDQQQKLWQSTAHVMMGEASSPLVNEPMDDPRFRDADWQTNPALNYVKQAYLLNAQFLNQLVDAFEFEDNKLTEQVRFYTRQLVSSMAPTNYIFTNPEACREILQSEGKSIARGIDNFIRDLKRSPTEAFKINQVDIDAFKLGVDIANTPGSVVFRNELIELIQYTASTPTVNAIPLLIVPPFINKYYILDLNQKKSLVKWLVDQGFCVFMISWVNPGAEMQEVEFEDYVLRGVIAAIEVVEEITGQPQCHATGYCVGGSLLGLAQAYLLAKGQNRIRSLTVLTTLFDFSDPGEVGNFLSEQMLPLIEQNVLSKGYLDGRILALGFSLLRENNLFWSFFIENYLKGKDPVPFDILYWNSDSTNIPAQAYLYYLRNFYIENKLARQVDIVINEVKIHLETITTPTYCLAAFADHIVLWHAAYKSASLLGGDVRFVLTESGHVAGVVNPPDKSKYSHWVNETRSEKPEEWLAGAQLTMGSWWQDWRQWLSQFDAEQVAPYGVGSAKYPPLDNAPGSYVKRRLERVESEAETL